MKRLFHESLWIIAILLIVIIQASLITNSSVWYYILHLPLLVSSILISFRLVSRGILVASISAYLLDLGSVLPFGIITGITLLSMAILIFFQKNIFKNYAVHAVVLNIGIATLAYHFFFLIACSVLQQFHLAEISLFNWSHYLFFAIIQTCTHTALVASIFFIRPRRIA